MCFYEHVELHEHVVEDAGDLDFLCEHSFHFNDLLPDCDLDYYVANLASGAPLYMLYTKNPAAGDVNPVATRVLLDQFKLSLPRVSHNVNILEFAPRGSVVFHSPHQAVATDEIVHHWPILFRACMPYVAFLARTPTHTVRNFVKAYRDIQHDVDAVVNVAQTHLQIKIDREHLTAGVIERVESTVIGAAIARMFEPIGFLVFNVHPPPFKIKTTFT